MGIKVSREGINYGENIIDPLLAFNTSQTWTATSGTGSASLDSDNPYVGASALKIINTAPTTDLILTNTSQSTIIPYTASYRHSFYMKKDEVDEFMTLEIKTYQGVSEFNTQTYVLGSETTSEDINDVYTRFVSDVDYNFTKGDDISFTFNLKGKAGTVLVNTSVWIDGMMLEPVNTDNKMPSKFKVNTSSFTSISESGEPTLADNTFIKWMANASGTLDGTAYEKGDVLITAKSSGVQKTQIQMDFSAI